MNKYYDVILLEKQMNEDRINIIEDCLDVYQTQELKDICEQASRSVFENIGNYHYLFYFDDTNQLVKVEKVQ